MVVLLVVPLEAVDSTRARYDFAANIACIALVRLPRASAVSLVDVCSPEGITRLHATKPRITPQRKNRFICLTPKLNRHCGEVNLKCASSICPSAFGSKVVVTWSIPDAPLGV